MARVKNAMKDYLLESIEHLDAGCFKWINGSLHNSFFDGLMPLVSYAGQGGIIWIVLGVLFFAFSRRPMKNAVLLMLLALLASYLLDEELLKNIFRRPRPFETLTGINLLVLPPHSYSFPSGHTANAFAAGLHVVMNGKHVRDKGIMASKGDNLPHPALDVYGALRN